MLDLPFPRWFPSLVRFPLPPALVRWCTLLTNIWNVLTLSYHYGVKAGSGTLDPAVDTVTRELGATFLSPDYREVRALLARYAQKELPISVGKEIRAHDTGGAVTTMAEWEAKWVANITGDPDAAKNAARVSEALDRYFDLHVKIFGNYSYATRRPPR